PIHFHHEPCPMAREIDDEMPDWHLPAPAGGRSRLAQQSPHRALGIGHLPTQAPSPRDRSWWRVLLHPSGVIAGAPSNQAVPDPFRTFRGGPSPQTPRHRPAQLPCGGGVSGPTLRTPPSPSKGEVTETWPRRSLVGVGWGRPAKRQMGKNSVPHPRRCPAPATLAKAAATCRPNCPRLSIPRPSRPSGTPTGK